MAEDSQSQSLPRITPISADAAKGLIGSLFDFSFRSFVTPKIIQIVFVLMLLGLGVSVLSMIGTAFRVGTGTGIFVLVLSPLIFLVGVLFVRMYLELVIVLFRIYETLQHRPV